LLTDGGKMQKVNFCHVVRDKLENACIMWGEQLHDTHILNDILSGECSFHQFQGFLLETYHYIKMFPDVLSYAERCAQLPELKELLHNYTQQEIGHEGFVLSALMDTGVTFAEVEASVPLVSTQNILNLLKELFVDYPWTPLFVAKVIEEGDFSSMVVEITGNKLKEIYDITYNPLVHLYNHAEIDFQLRHFFILDNNKHLIELIEKQDIHDILNRIHDIKHAFDLQKLEIKDYYSHPGNYFPRQKVDFFGV
ncbi:MAG TPA: hypothetical protein PLP75_14080, partial [Burkholderiales bacterium]|nr:hypothetical protein [Burkholderiales bacterium]